MWTGTIRSQDESDEIRVRTNLESFGFLAQQIGEQAGREYSDLEPLAVTVLPRESAWYVETRLLQGLQAAGVAISSLSASTHSAEFGLAGLSIRYDNNRTDGIFGPRLVDRIAEVKMIGKIEDRASGRILYRGEFERSVRDTIPIALIRLLENPAIPATRAQLPAGGLFSTLAEPLIVLGTIGIAVFLLFSVRS